MTSDEMQVAIAEVVGVHADANLGEGVETVSDAIRLIVEGARAVNLGLAADTAVPKA